MEMTFPRLMLVTQSNLMRPDFGTALEAALKGGARFIQLREKEATPTQRCRLASLAKTLCDEYGAQLVINGDYRLAHKIGAGVHLPEARPVARARQLLGKHALIGKSVHSPEAALNAQQEGCNYLVFGSVFPTASHPGRPAAGLDALRSIASQSDMPLYAIGGITPENIDHCLRQGAYGVALIRSVWEAADVEAATRRILAALQS
jgi:thiamine-phosphate diphosphorylase